MIALLPSPIPLLYMTTGSTTGFSAVAHAWRKKSKTAVTMNLIKSPPHIGFVHRFKPRYFGAREHDHRDVLSSINLNNRKKSFGLFLKIALHLGRGTLCTARQAESKRIAGDSRSYRSRISHHVSHLLLAEGSGESCSDAGDGGKGDLSSLFVDQLSGDTLLPILSDQV